MPFVPLKIRLPPLTIVLVITGGATTLIRPLLNWLVLHARPAPGVAGVMANEPEMLPAFNIWKVSPAAKGFPLMLTRLSVPPHVMLPLVDVTASFVPEPLSLMTVVPARLMLPLAEMVPVALWPVVMPIVVFVPAGDRVAPGETVNLPLI